MIFLDMSIEQFLFCMHYLDTVGAMAMQGLVAYYYDFVNKDNAVELNQCRHNHMGMDVLYRHEPNYTPQKVKKEYLGGCRNTLKYCEGRLL